ncbi:MAG: hypothetical protein DWQ34_07225 [Planctomycetota bacterium]|nr:MAG: hypothetical protein DWQ29_16730 [Planctomycetota bacterium]REJ94994.1 MAG: hypothetical protein DWQ34_07225 [Planctomycetota bacterium]REK23437.1 MAG: hypothetical protein DWQ41_16945 [Planctomycetota bacterium]REK38923.1 MAG: hypothetical protein DWQ45_03510 [Planctomycetota bacterium]
MQLVRTVAAGRTFRLLLKIQFPAAAGRIVRYSFKSHCAKDATDSWSHISPVTPRRIPRDSSMPAFFHSIQGVSIEHVLEGIGFWWANASAEDFGVVAAVVVIGVWFMTKYYID